MYTNLKRLPVAAYKHRHNVHLRPLFVPNCQSRNFSKTSNISESENDNSPAATIVQGPSLLTNTGHARPSPTLFFLPGLRSLPFWTAPPPPPPPTNAAAINNKEESSKSPKTRIAYNDPIVTKIVEHLEDNHEIIREEYMSAILGVQSPIITRATSLSEISSSAPSSFKIPLQPDYDLNSKGMEHNSTSASTSLHEGQWDWHSYIQNGKRSSTFPSHCPKTCQIIDEIGSQHLFTENPFGFCFFSTLSGKSKIKPHCGPMNLRLRIHLPLIVPPTNSNTLSESKSLSYGLRVGTQMRQWIPGKAIVLDDSYEHEVWNDTDDPRVILLIDIWHPDILVHERQEILNMFDYAKDQGWIGKKKL